MTHVAVCHVNDITPGTGVCAQLDNRQVALFRPDNNDEIFALDNMDPFAQANVLSRGLICEHQNELWIASPLKKQRFNLRDGRCLEHPDVMLTTYSVTVTDGQISIEKE